MHPLAPQPVTARPQPLLSGPTPLGQVMELPAPQVPDLCSKEKQHPALLRSVYNGPKLSGSHSPCQMWWVTVVVMRTLARSQLPGHLPKRGIGKCVHLDPVTEKQQSRWATPGIQSPESG